MNYLLMGILIISLIGLFYLIYEIFKLKKEFIPLLTFSIIIIALFLFGILGQLLLGMILLTIIGITSFIYFVIIKMKKSEKPIIKLLVIFSLIMLILLIGFQKLQFMHYDDFFNWGNIAKEIYQNDKIISEEFTISKETINYIPGIALLVYYFTKIIGFSEANCIIVKNIFIIATIIPLFTWTKKEKKTTYIVPTIISLIVLYGIIIYDYKTILVDILQAIFAISLLIFVYINKEEKNIKNNIVFIILALVLFMIKASSILYIAFDLFILLVFKIINIKDKRNLINWIVTLVVLSILVLSITGIWNTLTNKKLDLDSKFNLNITQWKNGLDEKARAYEQENGIISENAKQIYFKDFLNRYIETTFNINFNCFRYLMIIEITLLVLVLMRKINLKQALKIGVTILTIYVIYSMFYIVVYFFMMNYYEIKILSAIERYYGQLLVYFIGIMFVIGKILIDEDKIRLKEKNSRILYLIILILFQISIIPNIYNNGDYTTFFIGELNNTYTQKIKQIEGINKIEKNANVFLIYDTNKDPFCFTKEVLEYYLESNNIENYKKQEWKSYYIIVVNVNNIYMISENGGMELSEYSIYKCENEVIRKWDSP